MTIHMLFFGGEGGGGKEKFTGKTRELTLVKF